jgi:uncharacterized SAM-binding protein YcdF (DUF218 family)
VSLAWGVLAFLLDRNGSRPLRRGTWDAIVVLGCRVLPGRVASPELRRRVETAMSLWRQGRAPRVVFAGGPGRDHRAGATAASAGAPRRGLPESAILVEVTSTAPDETALFSSALDGASRVLVVTDSAGAFRCERVLSRHFESVAVAATAAPLPIRIRNALREALAVSEHALRELVR